MIRTHTNDLNNLEVEYDLLTNQNDLIKSKLTEQNQEYNSTIKNYHSNLNAFRLILTELERELKQETDDALINLRNPNTFRRQKIYDDTNALLFILENKIDDKNVTNSQLHRSIDDYREKILKQKQLSTKREDDLKSMDHIEEQLKHNINVSIVLDQLVELFSWVFSYRFIVKPVFK